MEPQELTGAVAPPEPDAAKRLAGTHGELEQRAIAVLDANWMGHATRASARLYPHQWSWDSACIAIGYSTWDQARAQAELSWIFAGQWANGLLPHIRFARTHVTSRGPSSGGPISRRSRPADPPTSGIVQPPVHATAVWKVFRRARDGDDAKAFLRELRPKLAAWHDYLYRERTRGDDGLVEIWHPWESGMDNSPLWDAALERITPSTRGDPRVPARRRRVRRCGPASDERPLRPLRVPRQALPRPRTTTPNASATTVRSSCGTCSSTRCSSRRIAISRRSRA